MLRTLPCLGFSLAVSGSTMPPAVFSSASRRLTSILSLRGTTFMPLKLLEVKQPLKGDSPLFQRAARPLFAGRIPLGIAVDAHQRADYRVQYDVLADRLRNHTVGAGPQRLPDEYFVRIRRDQDARKHGVYRTY